MARGLGPLTRHSIAIWNVAYSDWFFWDGRVDTLWGQALEPLEEPAEHGTSRLAVLHVVHDGLIGQLDVELDRRGNVVVRDWMTSQPGVFAAGDTVRGASLVVHAINEGRQAAAAIDQWLKAT